MAIKILKGLKRIKIFTITANTSEVYTPGTAISVPGAQSIGLDPEVSEWKVYADDTVYDAGSDWNGMKMTIQLAELPLELYPHFEGGEYDEATKEYSYGSDDTAPEIGMTFAAQTSDGQYLMTRLLSLRATKVKADFKTKGEGGDSSSPVTIEATVMTRKTDNKAKTHKYSTTSTDLSWLDTLVTE